MTCTWEPDTSCLDDKWGDLTEEDQQRALMLATSSLQMLTYYRVGACPTTVRPCSEVTRCGCLPVNRSRCGCNPLSEVDLPGPVGKVYAIIINGVIVAANAGWDRDEWDGLTWDPIYDMTDFRLDDGHLLVWQGDGPSPFLTTRQDLSRPLSAPDTWGVVYSRSHPVGPEARIAVARLAMEFAKACGKAKGNCSLPKGVTNVVRNGVSFTVEAGLFPGGLTGDQIVDAFILKWAPAHSPVRTATVFDPRRKAPRRTGGTYTVPFGGSF